MRKRITCYYKEIYNKKQKCTMTYIKIFENDVMILKDFFKVEGPRNIVSAKKVLWQVFQVLKSLELNEYKNEECIFIVRVSDIRVYNMLISLETKKLTGSILYEIRRYIEEKDNWIIKRENFKDKFFFKHYIKYPKRKTNYIDKTVNLKIDNFLKKGYKNIVFFDMEMNCIDKGESFLKHGEIVSIGAVKYNISTGLRQEYYSLVKPKIKSRLSERCIAITGLRQEDIDTAEDLQIVIEKFNNWVGSEKTLFSSWGMEDIKVIKYENAIKGYRSECVNRMRKNYSDFQAEFNKYYVREQNKISLKNAINLLGIESIGDYHNALDDSINLYKVYAEYIRQLNEDRKKAGGE